MIQQKCRSEPFIHLYNLNDLSRINHKKIVKGVDSIYYPINSMEHKFTITLKLTVIWHIGSQEVED